MLRIYRSNPAGTTLVLSTLALLIVWNAPLFGGAVIPYDYLSAHYPWYVDAIRAARSSPFCLYNPFNDGGQPTWNVFAFNDPLQWLPVYLPLLPGYTALQSFELAHLVLIPCGLLLVARANGVPRERWIWIVGLSVIAYALGPTLKYMQQSVGIVAGAFIVLTFGALEAFRTTGLGRYALLAGACVAYTFEAFVYPAIFLPIVLAAYLIANARELFATRKRVLAIAAATVLALVIAAPALSISLKIDHSLEVSRHLGAQLTELLPLTKVDAAALLGAPASSLRLVALPAALIVLMFLGFSHLTKWQKVCYGVALAALVLYGFGDATVFGSIFRHAYVLADLIRRPYTTWYVLVPMLLVLATIGLRGGPRYLVLASTALSLLAVQASMSDQPSALAVAGILLTLILATVAGPRIAVLVPLAICQWLVIDWIPFLSSNWQPQPIPVAEMYMRPVADVGSFFGTVQSRSSSAYRIANAGLRAEVGPSAGMFQYYNTAADYNTFIPHELVRELHTAELHALLLPHYFATHPAAIGSAPWERLAVKYYILSPAVLSTIPASRFAHSALHVVKTDSYWKVLQDDDAEPFVAGVRPDGSTVDIPAAMTRDSFTFTVPPSVAAVRFAAIYDSWWHARDVTVDSHTAMLIDDGGQLELTTDGVGGDVVTVAYSDRATVIALSCSIVAQLVILCYLAVCGGIRVAKRLHPS